MDQMTVSGMGRRASILDRKQARAWARSLGCLLVLWGASATLDTASAQVSCPPPEVTGTFPSIVITPICPGYVQSAAPGAAAATSGAQSIGAETNNVAQDRMNTLRRQAQGLPGTPPLGYASAPFGYAASPFQEFVPVDGALGYAKSPVVTKAPPAPAVATTVRPALWVRGFGEWERRDTTTTVATTSGPVPLDLGYRSSMLGVTFGGDLLISRLTSPSDGLIIGVMGGFVDTDIRLRAGGTHSIEGGHIGVYSTYFNGGFFADAMFKVDLLNFGTDILVLPSSADLTNYNVTANIGYKFDLPSRFYIEPTIGIEHVESEYSNQTITAATLAILEDSHMTRGRFGARFGTEWMSGNVRIEPSILFLGYYYFDATGATIQGAGAAGGTISLPTDDGKFRGEIQAALNVFDLSSGVSGFVRGDIRFQDDLFGGGARVGLRYQW